MAICSGAMPPSRARGETLLSWKTMDASVHSRITLLPKVELQLNLSATGQGNRPRVISCNFACLFAFSCVVKVELQLTHPRPGKGSFLSQEHLSSH
jgi:hypothetical protein